MTNAASNLWAFARAVLTGSFAAAAPGLVLTVPMALSMLFELDDPNGGLRALPIMAAPLIIAFPCVLAGSILVGIPATLVLGAMGKECEEHYVALGTLFGALPFVVIAILFAEDAPGTVAALSALGALGGGVTGWVWGRHRDRLRETGPHA